jgi:hypothetical protein
VKLVSKHWFEEQASDRLVADSHVGRANSAVASGAGISTDSSLAREVLKSSPWPFLFIQVQISAAFLASRTHNLFRQLQRQRSLISLRSDRLATKFVKAG